MSISGLHATVVTVVGFTGDLIKLSRSICLLMVMLQSDGYSALVSHSGPQCQILDLFYSAPVTPRVSKSAGLSLVRQFVLTFYPLQNLFGYHSIRSYHQMKYETMR